jgi:hypothetical protein
MYRVQIIVRNPDDTTAETKAYAIYTLLRDSAHVTWPYNGAEVWIYKAACTEPPYSIGRDAKKRSEYIFNFTLTARRKSA